VLSLQVGQITELQCFFSPFDIFSTSADEGADEISHLLNPHRAANDPTQKSNGSANEGCDEYLAHIRKARKPEYDKESSGNAELK
jgi:hypothetical protein